MEKILKNQLVEYAGNEFLVFEVAALKETDAYGKTHTVYISKKVAAPKKKGSKKKESEK